MGVGVGPGTGAGTGEGVGVRVGAGPLAGGGPPAGGGTLAGAADDDPVGAAERGACLVVVVALPRCVELTGVTAGTPTAPDPSARRAAQLTRPQEEEEDLAPALGVPPCDPCRIRPAPVPQSARTAAAVQAAYRPGPVIQELQPGLGGRSPSS